MRRQNLPKWRRVSLGNYRTMILCRRENVKEFESRLTSWLVMHDVFGDWGKVAKMLGMTFHRRKRIHKKRAKAVFGAAIFDELRQIGLKNPETTGASV